MKTKKQLLDEVMSAIIPRVYLGKRYGLSEDSVHALNRDVEDILGVEIVNAPTLMHVGLKLMLLLGGGKHDIDPQLKLLALDYYLEYCVLLYEEAERIIYKS